MSYCGSSPSAAKSNPATAISSANWDLEDSLRTLVTFESSAAQTPMRSLVSSNIKQAFAKLVQKRAAADAIFAALSAQEPGYERIILLEDFVSFRPQFYLDGCTICCAQHDFLGFYVLQQSVRQLLKSVNFYIAGNLLNSNGLYGPGIASHYSAAFHGLHALLALEGHVIFDSTFWPIASRRPKYFGEIRFAALLTRHNKWVFEKRSRNHLAIWAEVAQAYNARLHELPSCFHELFHFMYRGEYEEEFTLDNIAEALNDTPLDDWSGEYQQPFRVKLDDRCSEFLQRISETRHRSVYESFGEDPHVVFGLVNRECFSTEGIDNQAVAFGQFCESLMTDVASDTLRIAQSLTVSAEIANAFFLTTYMEPFDKPRVDQIPGAKLRDVMTRICNWAFHPAERIPAVPG